MNEAFATQNTSAPESTATPGTPSAHESLLQRVEQVLDKDGKKVITVMDAIGKDCLKALSIIQTYLPSAEALASAIFPSEATAVAGTANVIQLILNAVATVEAKWAAGNESSKNGAQKFGDVLTLVEGTVTDLLAHLGIQANTAYVTNLINIVVSILNVRTVTAGQTA